MYVAPPIAIPTPHHDVLMCSSQVITPPIPTPPTGFISHANDPSTQADKQHVNQAILQRLVATLSLVTGCGTSASMLTPNMLKRMYWVLERPRPDHHLHTPVRAGLVRTAPTSGYMQRHVVPDKSSQIAMAGPWHLVPGRCCQCRGRQQQTMDHIILAPSNTNRYALSGREICTDLRYSASCCYAATPCACCRGRRRHEGGQAGAAGAHLLTCWPAQQHLALHPLPCRALRSGVQ
jgi:hypothetical protein